MSSSAERKKGKDEEVAGLVFQYWLLAYLGFVGRAAQAML
jgi:hypothetical protein